MSNTPIPYKGLVPFSEEDSPFFFGRERDTEIIAANLMTSRLTLLYGVSGVGKSSVLRAGVVPHLRQLAHAAQDEADFPDFFVIIFNQWKGDVIDGLQRTLQEAVAKSTLRQKTLELSPSPSLYQSLKACSDLTQSELFIILDQFEEYFLYHPEDEGRGTFADEFARAVNDSTLQVNFIISIREDGLAKLDRFKGQIANLFGNYLRIKHLDYNAARTAIVKPIEFYNRTLSPSSQPVMIEAELVEDVLKQIRSGQVILDPADNDKRDKWSIETSYLQLIMARLWEQEISVSSHALRLNTLKQLGGASHIVRTHVDASVRVLSVKEQDIAANIFRYLVTPSGTKIALTVADLASLAEVPEAKLLPVLHKLAGPEARILRPVEPSPDRPNTPSYEIMHDLLAIAILDWRQRYERDRSRPYLERLMKKLSLK